MTMAYDAPHSEHLRRPKNVGIVEREKQSPSPPLNFRRRPSHRSKSRSLSSLSILSSNSTTSSSSSSSISSFNNNVQQEHMSNKNIITNSITSTPDISYPSRIPFSWEKIPGIPKQQKQDSKKELPLPPNQHFSSKRYIFSTTSIREEMMCSFQEDPFFMAMVECSKDKKHREMKQLTARGGGGRRSISSVVMSNLSDRIGMMNMYGSCKSVCNVSESSIVPLRRDGGRGRGPGRGRV